MRGYHLNFSPLHFLLLLLFLVLCVSVRTLGGDPCATAFCGKGTCVPLATDYDCTCNPGWKKDLGILLSSRSCVVPNCTINLECGNSAPPPPLALPPPPFFDLLSPCFLVWCGEGTCLVNGTKHTCECNTGSGNLLDLPDFPCFKKCSLGVDCNGILLSATPPPPNGTLASPSWSPPNGSDKILKRWSNVVLSLSTIILAWIMYE